MSDKLKSRANIFWRCITNPWCLFFAAVLVLSIMLGAKELWTQEWRWANVTHQMILRHDYLHPYLAQYFYYDKPLVSYWLVLLTSFVTGGFNIWAIRLPSILAGLISIACTVHLGKRLISREAGVLAGWMLITSFFFVFWARVGSSDMLNVAGIMLAITWYFARREKSNFFSYLVFFVILAIAALCKGLIAPALAFVALIPDLLYDNKWTRHLKLSFLIALLIGIAIYFTPFLLSIFINPNNHYGANGLHLVFQENFLRYFHPFDHEGPIYTYFINLPLYMFPWILFYIPALVSNFWRWRSKTISIRWLTWANLFIFIFLTLSGSRRNYYILPMLPFAMLLTADWICAQAEIFNFRKRLASYTAAVFYLIVLLAFGVLYPVAYSDGGAKMLAQQIRAKAIKIKPWKDWKITMLDAQNKVAFYLRSPNLINFIDAKEHAQLTPNRKKLLESFPILLNNPNNSILILRQNYLPYIKDITAKYTVIVEPPTFADKLLKKHDPSAPVALIPKISRS